MSEHVCIKCGHFDSDIRRISAEVDVRNEKMRSLRRVIRDKKEFDNTYYPGVEKTDLVHEVHGVTVSQHRHDRNVIWFNHNHNRFDEKGVPKQLCHNCGWNTQHQCGYGYTSRLKVLHIRGNSAIWDLGPNGPWMLKDETNDANGSFFKDYTAQQFLRKEGLNLPLVEMHKFGGANDKFHFTIMARAKGTSLGDKWDKLTLEQQKDISRDLRNYLKEWRQITRPHMQKVDGSELRDIFIGTCHGRGCVKTGRNEDEWLENLTPAIRKGLLYEIWKTNRGWYPTPQDKLDSWVKEVDEKIEHLKTNFPRGGPYVLTHGDLHPESIFISDDNEEKKLKVSAIIDWELCGFYPWWAESLRGNLGSFTLSGQDPDLFCPGYDIKEWDKIYDIISPIKEAWWEGGNHCFSMHTPDQSNNWFSKPFCACKPWVQGIRDDQLGLEDEHHDVFDVDSTDSEDEEEDDLKQFPSRDRKFLRWFNKISNFESKKVGSGSSSSNVAVR